MSRTLDHERCYRAVAGRDARFDGWFFTAIHTTGIYCRPSCPARTPHARNVSFFTTAAAAQGAGFRACRRCRPDAVPGSPEWDVRADVVARAMRLIADGEVERSGVPGLAARLGYSERQLHRLLVGELGVGPLALARAQRAQTARLLIETTDLPMADAAFAAGFASIRQFNDTVREVFATTPTALRSTSPRSDGGSPGWLTLRLAARAPYAADEVLLFLGAHAVPGLEAWDGTTFSRVLDLPHGPAVVQLSPAAGGGAGVTARLRVAELRDLGAA
ncbi:MAG TPA: Ada metal-binding domain-containing protein, partial [Blastococcus sp.]